MRLTNLLWWLNFHRTTLHRLWFPLSRATVLSSTRLSFSIATINSYPHWWVLHLRQPLPHPLNLLLIRKTAMHKNQQRLRWLLNLAPNINHLLPKESPDLRQLCLQKSLRGLYSPFSMLLNQTKMFQGRKGSSLLNCASESQKQSPKKTSNQG